MKTSQRKTQSKFDKFIDSFISALKIAGSSDLFLGIFVVLEGLSLIFIPELFPIFIVFSILIAFAWAIEWFFNVLRGQRTIINILQRILIVVILIALTVYCFLMIFDDLFRLNVDRILVCATTIADGIKNLVHTLKFENRSTPRAVLIVFSLIYINYGVVYCFLGGSDASFFTTVMHGIVFVFCGLTNIWLSLYAPKKKNKQKMVRMKRL